MKPKVICHIMGSVDGRVLVGKWSKPFGNRSMTDLLKVYPQTGQKLHTDAWTFGKNTVTEIFPEKFTSASPKAELLGEDERTFKAASLTQRIFISIDPEADIKYESATLRGDSIVAVVGKQASREYLQFLRSIGVSYIVVDDIANLRDVLEAVNLEFGVGCISLQGGGVLDGGMLAQGLIDELSYLVYPGVDGSAGSVSIFNYIGVANPHSGQSLELLSAEKLEYGIVWLRYKIHA